MTSISHISRRTFVLAAGAFGLGLSGLARGADFPQRRVAMIVPYPAGTAVDVVGRFVATNLGQIWQQPVTVENRAGADGVIGTRAVKAAPADGHTILYVGPPFLFAPLLVPDAGYDPLQDFVPVARVTAPVYMLAANPQAPVRSFKELIDFAKRTGTVLDVGTAGSHSAATVSGMVKAAGIKINLIRYTNTGQLISDAIAGHIPLILHALSILNPIVREGKLTALATSGPKRSIVAPDVPTAMEAGATGFSVVSWNGAFVRTETPQNIVAGISDGIRKVTSGDGFVEFCRLQGLEPAFEDGGQWAKELPDERSYLESLLRESGVLSAK